MKMITIRKDVIIMTKTFFRVLMVLAMVVTGVCTFNGGTKSEAAEMLYTSCDYTSRFYDDNSIVRLSMYGNTFEVTKGEYRRDSKEVKYELHFWLTQMRYTGHWNYKDYVYASLFVGGKLMAVQRIEYREIYDPLDDYIREDTSNCKR